MAHASSALLNMVNSRLDRTQPAFVMPASACSRANVVADKLVSALLPRPVIHSPFARRPSCLQPSRPGPYPTGPYMTNGQLYGGWQPQQQSQHAPPPPLHGHSGTPSPLPAARPSGGTQQVAAAPAAELTQTATIRNAVNLKKATLEVGSRQRCTRGRGLRAGPAGAAAFRWSGRAGLWPPICKGWLRARGTSTVPSKTNAGLKRRVRPAPSLQVRPLEGSPSLLSISFTFDASAPCRASTFVLAAEDAATGCKLAPARQPAAAPVAYQAGVRAGRGRGPSLSPPALPAPSATHLPPICPHLHTRQLGLKFPPAGDTAAVQAHVVDTSLHSQAELQRSGRSEGYPLVVRLETVGGGLGRVGGWMG